MILEQGDRVWPHFQQDLAALDRSLHLSEHPPVPWKRRTRVTHGSSRSGEDRIELLSPKASGTQERLNRRYSWGYDS